MYNAHEYTCTHKDIYTHTGTYLVQSLHSSVNHIFAII